MLGTRPKVHTGFYKAWTAKGLHTEVIHYLQVSYLLLLKQLSEMQRRQECSVDSDPA